MPHEIVFSPGARAWLKEKLDEIGIENEDKAQALLTKIDEKCRLLAQFPNMTQGGRGVTPDTRHVSWKA
jgi:plasmid stabilization system protein ParE